MIAFNAWAERPNYLEPEEITLKERAMNELHCGLCLRRGKEEVIGTYSVEMMQFGKYLPPITIAQCRDRDACLWELECRRLTPGLKEQGEVLL